MRETSVRLNSDMCRIVERQHASKFDTPNHTKPRAVLTTAKGKRFACFAPLTAAPLVASGECGPGRRNGLQVEQRNYPHPPRSFFPRINPSTIAPRPSYLAPASLLFPPT